jgi:two-component system KDP operon response regulator KdpE
MDLDRRLVKVGRREIHLTPQEYELLAYLLRHVGKVVTHPQLLNEIWGPGHTTQRAYLRVYMAQLRRKLEPDPAHPRFLMTEPGVGYWLKDHT